MRPKKCNNCGKIIENRNSTLVVWCSPLCAIAIANKRKAAKRKKETQQMKVDIRSHADWIAILQEEVNLLVRTIDRGWPCISSGVIECQFHDIFHRLPAKLMQRMKRSFISFESVPHNLNNFRIAQLIVYSVA